jgi:ketosteroid isomerase-like protein
MSSQTRKNLPNALDHEMWRPHLENADYPQPVLSGIEARLRKIEEESAIRDLMVKYCYNYDSNNVDGVISVFDTDCTLVNPRGTFIGSDAVRRCYAHLTTTRRYSFHHVTNVTIRLSDDMAEAVTTTYWTDKHVGPTGAIDGSDGTYTDHLRKVGAEWKITQRRITANIFYVITPLPDAWPPVPEPTTKDNTRAWVGAKYMR